MRTKTLLLSAAVLAAGLLSSVAQSVYSQNVVGYYNVSVPAGKFFFIANQFANNDGSNSVNNVFSGGMVSDPNGVTNTTLYYWNGHGYNILSYYTAADFGAGNHGNGWYDLSYNYATNVTLSPGSGSFLYNAAGSAITVSVLGTVTQGNVTNTVTSGFNVYSIIQPISTNLDSSVVNFPGSSVGDGSGTTYDNLYLYNGHGYNILQYLNAADAAPTPAGWYDLSYTLQSTNSAYYPQVGQAFFINHTTTPKTWVSSFTVQ